MNALNILSGLSPSPPRSRTSSSSNINIAGLDSEITDGGDEESGAGSDPVSRHSFDEHVPGKKEENVDSDAEEKTPLLNSIPESFGENKEAKFWGLPKRVADAIMASLSVVLALILAPGRYLVSCLNDDKGSISFLAPMRRLGQSFSRRRRKSAPFSANSSGAAASRDEYSEKATVRPKQDLGEDVPSSISGLENTGNVSSDSEGEHLTSPSSKDRPASNTRSKTAARDEIAPAKKSIRIKLHNEASLNKEKRHRATRSMDNSNTEEERVAAIANSLKSPSSPTSSTKLKYPRAPAPPRPLVPRRQPSFALNYNTDAPKKTLIIDLDETLIHSMAKGGKMSTGHMVEVKIQGSIGGGATQTVPILYYVHERPHCHEFLRKVRGCCTMMLAHLGQRADRWQLQVCKWYNLIAFTASVQEYADPVVDWLERERPYFSGRYYRQHCTFRNGAYIKDLSQVEPDLSKVMILDNSPMSYIFHEGKSTRGMLSIAVRCIWLMINADNAIPIEGWISDPTDNDLRHLIPLLEGLQYVTDVRALLALRLGQAERA